MIEEDLLITHCNDLLQSKLSNEISKKKRLYLAQLAVDCNG